MTEYPPALQAGDTAFDRRPGARQCPVEGLVGRSEVTVRTTLDARRDPGSAALVGQVRQNRDALALADPDDPVGASGVRS